MRKRWGSAAVVTIVAVVIFWAISSAPRTPNAGFNQCQPVEQRLRIRNECEPVCMNWIWGGNEVWSNVECLAGFDNTQHLVRITVYECAVNSNPCKTLTCQ